MLNVDDLLRQRRMPAGVCHIVWMILFLLSTTATGMTQFFGMALIADLSSMGMVLKSHLLGRSTHAVYASSSAIQRLSLGNGHEESFGLIANPCKT